MTAERTEKAMRVLVIDDEEGMREGMRRVLTKRGFIADLAPDGETGIALFDSNSYDIALVDLKMPGKSGFEVTEHINQAGNGRTVVVIVSALATVEAAVDVTRHGAFDFLVKPFTPDDLVEVVDRAVVQRRLLFEHETYLSELDSERSQSRRIINWMQQGLVVLNIERRPVLVNPKAEYFFGVRYRHGMSLVELIGDNAEMNALLNAVEWAAGTDTEPETTRLVTLRIRGNVIEARIGPSFRDGALSGIMILLRDITKEFFAEEDKKRFVSMVAHELKSPLAAIINYVNLILSGALDDDFPKIKEILTRCKIRGEDLLDLVRDLLYINQHDAGKTQKSIEPLNVKELIEAQVEFLRMQAQRKNIAISIEAADSARSGADSKQPVQNPFTVMADRGDLDRIFLNLLSNGLKYNVPGGRLDITLTRSDDEVVVRVADTGIGMRAEDMEHLFQQFYRIRNSKTAAISGTGLGLATVKRVLGDYNGRISVESKPEVGSTFTVHFPARIQAGLPPEAQPEVPAVPQPHEQPAPEPAAPASPRPQGQAQSGEQIS